MSPVVSSRLVLHFIFATGRRLFFLFFFFNDTATTEIYTLSLHDALPISAHVGRCPTRRVTVRQWHEPSVRMRQRRRSEEHTSELQSPCNLVCRLLLEKKKKMKISPTALTRRISTTIRRAYTPTLALHLTY